MSEGMSKVGELIESINALRDAVESFERKLRISKWVQWALAGVAAVLLGVVIVLSVTVVKLMDVVDDVKQSQVAGCEAGNAFRGDIIDFVDQRDLNYTRALADVSGASEATVNEFLQSLEEGRTVPESFKPRDCEALYG